MLSKYSHADKLAAPRPALGAALVRQFSLAPAANSDQALDPTSPPSALSRRLARERRPVAQAARGWTVSTW